MPTWYVQDDDEVKEVDEARLRKGLRKGDYSGAERVRREGEDVWRHLYELPLFREEVPNTGDPLEGARARVRDPFLHHLASFIAVVGAFTLWSGFPHWSVWWGIGLVMHGATTVTRLLALRSLPALPQTAQPTPLPTAAPTATPTATPTPARPLSPWRAQIEAALNAVAQRASTSGRTADLPDLTALRATADDLDQGVTELSAAVSPEEQARLELDLVEAETGARTATDARTVEAHQRTVTAIRERMAQTSALRDTLQRLQARQAALLHQIESLRLALTTAQLSSAGADITDELHELRAQEHASAEVDRELASARQRIAASRARTSG